MTNMFETNDQTAKLQAIREKYANDPEKMLNALVHSQDHIATLESERVKDREELTKAKTLAEVLETIKSTTAPSSQGTTIPTTANVLDDNTLNQKITAALQANTEKQRREETQKILQKTLIDKYGNEEKARQEFAKAASDNGMSVEELNNFALKTPQAFLKLVGIDGQSANVIPSVSRSTINVSSINTPAKPKDEMEPYRELLKTDRNKYFSQEIQNEIMRKAFEKAKAEGRI